MSSSNYSMTDCPSCFVQFSLVNYPFSCIKCAAKICVICVKTKCFCVKCKYRFTAGSVPLKDCHFYKVVKECLSLGKKVERVKKETAKLKDANDWKKSSRGIFEHARTKSALTSPKRCFTIRVTTANEVEPSSSKVRYCSDNFNLIIAKMKSGKLKRGSVDGKKINWKNLKKTWEV